MRLTTKHAFGFLIAVVGLPVAMSAGQEEQPKSATATVTVTTSDARRTVAVLSRGTGGDPAFLFCIDLVEPVPQKLEFSGRARVVYRPLPAIDVPEGIKISGPEDVSSALAVLPVDGKGWLFLAEGEKTVLSARDAAGGPILVPVRVVRRVDWIGDNGERRGMDIEPCFESAG